MQEDLTLKEMANSQQILRRSHQGPDNIERNKSGKLDPKVGGKREVEREFYQKYCVGAQPQCTVPSFS